MYQMDSLRESGGVPLPDAVGADTGDETPPGWLASVLVRLGAAGVFAALELVGSSSMVLMLVGKRSMGRPLAAVVV